MRHSSRCIQWLGVLTLLWQPKLAVSHSPVPPKHDLPGALPTETYGIVAQAHAHEGSIFALCLQRDGTVLSGGGRDRRLVQWGPGLVALQEAEVRAGLGSRE